MRCLLLFALNVISLSLAVAQQVKSPTINPDSILARKFKSDSLLHPKVNQARKISEDITTIGGSIQATPGKLINVDTLLLNNPVDSIQRHFYSRADSLKKRAAKQTKRLE